MKLDFIPSPEIKDKFKVVNTHLPIIRFKSIVDLRTVTLAEAEELVADGFGYLEKVKAVKEKS